MSVQANGTHAKDIALHFLRETGVERTTPAIIAKTISQAKNILNAGYTKEEVIITIDHVVNKGVHMYSIGYVSHVINDVLKEIEEKRTKEKAKLVAQQLQEEQAKSRSEVASNDDSTNRNKEKARRLSVQSRVREKFNFDMFEE